MLHGAHLDGFLEQISLREASINRDLQGGEEASLEIVSLRKLRQLVTLGSPIVKYPRTESVVSDGDPISRPAVMMKSNDDDEKKPAGQGQGGQLMLMVAPS